MELGLAFFVVEVSNFYILINVVVYFDLIIGIDFNLYIYQGNFVFQEVMVGNESIVVYNYGNIIILGNVYQLIEVDIVGYLVVIVNVINQLI